MIAQRRDVSSASGRGRAGRERDDLRHVAQPDGGLGAQAPQRQGGIGRSIRRWTGAVARDDLPKRAAPPGGRPPRRYRLLELGAGREDGSDNRRAETPGPPHAARQSPVLWAGTPGGVTTVLHPIGRMELTPPRGGMVPDSERRHVGQMARFQETLRRLAMVDEGFVEEQAGLGLGQAQMSALDPKTAALLQVGVSVAIGSPGVCLEWSTGRALAAGASEDEIADVLLAIAPVAGLGRVVCAAPDVATALGYDVAAALEEDVEATPEVPEGY